MTGILDAGAGYGAKAVHTTPSRQMILLCDSVRVLHSSPYVSLSVGYTQTIVLMASVPGQTLQ